MKRKIFYFLIVFFSSFVLRGQEAPKEEEKKEPNILDFFHDEVLPAHEKELVKIWQEYFYVMEGWDCSIELTRKSIFLDAKTLEFYTAHKAQVICTKRKRGGGKVSSNPILWELYSRWGYFYEGDLRNGTWKLIERVQKPKENDKQLILPEDENGESL